MSELDGVAKLTGGDVELGNFLHGADLGTRQSDYEASRLLLGMVSGSPMHDFASERIWRDWLDERRSSAVISSDYAGRDSQDYGRRYLQTNGGCIYIDLNHLELATPEVLSAKDYQAVWMSMLKIARQAQVDANARLPEGQRIVVLANNSDRQGHSYGGHHSFLMTRAAWDEMIRERMLPSVFNLMAYQASSIVFTGQGKVGSENGEPRVPFQISQRADFIESLLGEQTTFNRPLVNTRDEALCGSARSGSALRLPRERYARLHVIFYDTTLCPVATYLKVGVMQLMLRMIEARQVDADLILEAPLVALRKWSKDPDLDTRMSLMSGRKLTAVELQLEFLARARRFEASGGFDATVMDAGEILALWEDTLVKLKARDFAALRGRIDWVLKRALLEKALMDQPDWEWDAPELTYLDQIYSSLDPADSLFFPLLEARCIDWLGDAAEVERFASEPPEDTRAWTRAMLLRAAPRDQLKRIDWDHLEMHLDGRFGPTTCIELADPLAATRAAAEGEFLAAEDFADLLARLQAAGIVSTRQVTRSVAPSFNYLSDYQHYEIN